MVARAINAPAAHEIFIGRATELERAAAAFRDIAWPRAPIVAIQGMAGVGKTFLAREIYLRLAERFGSYQHIVINPVRPGTVDSWIAALGDQIGLDSRRLDGVIVANALRARRAIVHADNIDSPAAAELIALLARSLQGVPMLVSGRYTELGTAKGSGWHRIEVAPFELDDALALVRAELDGSGLAISDSELRELVRQIAGLPLALHLAAGYMRRGVTVARFLTRLRAGGFALEPNDPADHTRMDRAGGVLSVSFSLSRDLMLAEAGSKKAAWNAALVGLGWAPQIGFGDSLGAAITGLEETSGAFDDFMEAAVALSLVRRLLFEGRPNAAWAVHPLLGEFLRGNTERGETDARIVRWVSERANEAGPERAAAWDQLGNETPAISEWLGAAAGAVIAELLPQAWAFVASRGPIGPWLAAAARASQGTGRNVLWAMSQLASRAGELDMALDAATEMMIRAERDEDMYDRARALGKIADVLTTRGELDEALRIRREEQIPVYERLLDVRSRAITLGKVADILTTRGELNEALRIRRDEELPVYSQLGDVQLCAVAHGRIADILATRGELDEVLRIRREEQLPVYRRLGDVRSHAIVIGKIVDVLVLRGDLDEALRTLCNDQLPIYEELGDVRAQAITQAKQGEILLAQGAHSDALHILCNASLPVFERLGDVRRRAITMRMIAEIRMIYGEFDEASRILREEILPVFERLRDVQQWAISVAKLASVLAARGEIDRALQLLRNDALPVFEMLGDLRHRNAALRQIADLLSTYNQTP